MISTKGTHLKHNDQAILVDPSFRQRKLHRNKESMQQYELDNTFQENPGNRSGLATRANPNKTYGKRRGSRLKQVHGPNSETFESARKRRVFFSTSVEVRSFFDDEPVRFIANYDFKTSDAEPLSQTKQFRNISWRPLSRGASLNPYFNSITHQFSMSDTAMLSFSSLASSIPVLSEDIIDSEVEDDTTTFSPSSLAPIDENEQTKYHDDDIVHTPLPEIQPSAFTCVPDAVTQPENGESETKCLEQLFESVLHIESHGLEQIQGSDENSPPQFEYDPESCTAQLLDPPLKDQIQRTLKLDSNTESWVRVSPSPRKFLTPVADKTGLILSKYDEVWPDHPIRPVKDGVASMRHHFKRSPSKLAMIPRCPLLDLPAPVMHKPLRKPEAQPPIRRNVPVCPLYSLRPPTPPPQRKNEIKSNRN